MGDEERRIKNVAEYQQVLSAIADIGHRPVLAFRGQEDKSWLLESSAERRLNKGRDRISNNLFIELSQRQSGTEGQTVGLRQAGREAASRPWSSSLTFSITGL